MTPTRRRRGRPALASGEKRSVHRPLWFRIADLGLMEKAAKIENQDWSDWARKVLLDQAARVVNGSVGDVNV